MNEASITSSRSTAGKRQRENAGVENHSNAMDSSYTAGNPLIPEGLLPCFLADAFSELYEEDGLMVLGKGLGCLSLLAAFCRFYADIEEGHVSIVRESIASNTASSNNEPSVAPLVIVLGLKDGERQALVDILESWGTPPDLLPTMVTNEAGQGKDRAALYDRGGIFCITSRIFIVDLLTNIASPNKIDGLLVAHGENVTEQSTEAFILRIFQGQKQPFGSGFIKAFTDAPDQLMSGFAKVDKILKSLHVRRLYLYPRFHESIRQELESHPPSVTELHQELSPLQKEMQNAIAAAVSACIRELKSSTTLLEWNDSELSIENCVTTNFDRAISRQLEHDWHRLKPQTKQLVQDLRTLRTLFQSLIQYDCVTFWKLINSIKTMSAASRYPSLWLLTPAADVLFRKAKARVYNISRPRPTSQLSHPVPHLKAILEENPKWKLLKQILDEIRLDDAQRVRNVDCDGPRNVLVMVKDDKTVDTLREYLTDGKDRTLTLRWLRFLDQYNDRSRSITNCKGGISAISEESRLLLEEESRVRNSLFGKRRKRGHRDTVTKPKSQLNQIPDYLRKRRRIAVEKGRGQLTHQADDLDREFVLDDALEATEKALNDASFSKTILARIRADLNAEEDAMLRISNPSELRIILKSYSSIDGDQSSLFLQDMEPQYVVLYDTDVAFIRSVEMYEALSTHSDPVRVFFLMFEASSEQKTFMKTLEREQNAFERMIDHKKTMPPPALQVVGTQEMQQAMHVGSAGGSYMDGSLPLAFDSRRGRGKEDRSKERRDIAVDVREFRSALPSILHQGGMRLAPVTLTVGDFVLSNVHCVERKSISDLFGSFASGRLYTQAEAMSKHYKCPCLLIEFDPTKSFCLQNSNELGVEIRTESVCSKIALLTMHFPQLRILWSRSPHETLRIFRELKTNHDEVDVEKAIDIGRNESPDALLQLPAGLAEGEDEINEMARDMLLRLPGVNVHSARRIMQECDSLAELAEMSRDELRRIAGPVTGQKLFAFFRQKIAAT